jgi:hypothetical protein
MSKYTKEQYEESARKPKTDVQDGDTFWFASARELMWQCRGEKIRVIGRAGVPGHWFRADIPCKSECKQITDVRDVFGWLRVIGAEVEDERIEDSTEQDNQIVTLVCKKLLEAMREERSSSFGGKKMNEIVREHHQLRSYYRVVAREALEWRVDRDNFVLGNARIAVPWSPTGRGLESPYGFVSIGVKNAVDESDRVGALPAGGIAALRDDFGSGGEIR